jgi:hypothetical protein
LVSAVHWTQRCVVVLHARAPFIVHWVSLVQDAMQVFVVVSHDMPASPH